MKMIRIIHGLVAVLWMSHAMAGTGWYVTIQNNTPTDLAINFGGNDNWYCNDFCGPQLVTAGMTKIFYTEEAASPGATGIQGINLSGPYNSHVELWTAVLGSGGSWRPHPYSVNNNINSVFNYPEQAFVGTSSSSVDTSITANSTNGFYGTVYAGIYVNAAE